MAEKFGICGGRLYAAALHLFCPGGRPDQETHQQTPIYS